MENPNQTQRGGTQRPFAEAMKDLASQMQITTHPCRTNLGVEQIAHAAARIFAEVVAGKGQAFIDSDELAESLEDFAKFFTAESSYMNMILTGRNGTGKSTLIVVFARLVQMLIDYDKQESHNILNVPASELRTWRTTTRRIIYQDRPRFHNDLVKVPVLLIDELGAEHGTKEMVAITKSFVKDVLVERYDNGRPTIVTSLFDMQGLREWYGKQIGDIIFESYLSVYLEMANNRIGNL